MTQEQAEGWCNSLLIILQGDYHPKTHIISSFAFKWIEFVFRVPFFLNFLDHFHISLITLRSETPLSKTCSLMCVCVLVTQSYLTHCDPMDCGPPGSSVHGISQARTLEQVATPFCRGSSRPRDWTCVSCITRWALYPQPPGKPSLLFTSQKQSTMAAEMEAEG